ncbi:MAG: filamentous hemagglutinin N-terminal domain-containing protein, partial [Nitrospirae bacterium]|nr:filamentous hemagglutinin N-terminal domain-containing protein [Nitrospirota bacterium]
MVARKDLFSIIRTAALILIFSAAGVDAEVVPDGTMGKSGALTGPHYSIGSDLGKQLGGNLFHSFTSFNIYTGESATFSGPDTVQNIISRVTGGTLSSIDGLIRSTIPGAD